MVLLWLTGTPSEPSGGPTTLPGSVASPGRRVNVSVTYRDAGIRVLSSDPWRPTPSRRSSATRPQVGGSGLDGMTRNFVRRLHHHEMTALEQGIFLVDRSGVIRHRTVVGPTESVPRGRSLAEMVHTYCPGTPGA